MTDGRLSQENIRIFFERMMARPDIHQRSLRSPTKGFLVSILWLYVSLGIFIGGMMFSQNFGSQYLTYAITWCLSLVVILTFVNFLGSIRRQITSTKDFRELINKYLEEVNPNYLPIGLRWRLPEGKMMYIELWLDYKYMPEAFQPQNNAGMNQYSPLNQQPMYNYSPNSY